MKVVRGVLYGIALLGLGKGIIGIWYNGTTLGYLLLVGIRRGISPNFLLWHIYEVEELPYLGADCHRAEHTLL